MNTKAIVCLPTELLKAKKMPIGTVSRGRKKVAEGKWVDVPKGKGAKKVSSNPDKLKGSMNGRTITISVSETPAGAWGVYRSTYLGEGVGHSHRRETTYHSTKKAAKEKAQAIKASYEKRGARFDKDAKKVTTKKSVPKKKVKAEKSKVESSSNAFREQAAKGPIKSKMFPKVNSIGWNKDPSNMGQIMAKTQILFAEHRLSKFMGDPKLSSLIREVLPVDTDDWHKLSDMTDSSIKTTAIALNRIRMGKPVSEIRGYMMDKGPMWNFGPEATMRDILRVQHYRESPSDAIARESKSYKAFGMDEKESQQKAKKALDTVASKYKRVVDTVWGK